MSSHKCIYGNYGSYYGYRNAIQWKDIRLDIMQKDWFAGKSLLDIGCNTGVLAILISKEFQPRRVVGIDIDCGLIKKAKHNLYLAYRSALSESNLVNLSFPGSFPLSLPAVYGLLPNSVISSQNLQKFPYNITFITENFIESPYVRERFEVVLCMSITKWIHFNWGDKGIFALFDKIYRSLLTGGLLILESQPWESYKRKSCFSSHIKLTYRTIQYKPDSFPTILSGMGFRQVSILNPPCNIDLKGFKRPIWCFIKDS